MGRNGLVTVNVLKSDEDILVEIVGTGVFVKKIELTS